MQDLASNNRGMMDILGSVDLDTFTEDHRRLFALAKQSGDHAEVTRAYYEVLAPIIESWNGRSFHFASPVRKGQSRDDALRALHRSFAQWLQLRVGQRCLDIGCGHGAVMRDIARYSGSEMVGITIGKGEVERANQLNIENGIHKLCRVYEGDCHKLPFHDESFDSAYAIYSLKYFSDLRAPIAEAARILKPGGLFMIYDIIKTDLFDPDDAEHLAMTELFEFRCGMPSLHTSTEMAEVGAEFGLRVAAEFDASEGMPWYHYLVDSRLYNLLALSRFGSWSNKMAERLGLAPRGFAEFSENFLSGTVKSIAECGRKGILSGSHVLVLQKPALPSSVRRNQDEDGS